MYLFSLFLKNISPLEPCALARKTTLTCLFLLNFLGFHASGVLATPPQATSHISLDRLRIFDRDDEITSGPVFGIYIAPLPDDNEDDWYPFTDEGWNVGDLVLGQFQQGYQPPTGSGHACVIAKLLGYQTYESFCGYVYDHYKYNQYYDRYISVFFIGVAPSPNTNEESLVYISPWHTFKGYGQLNTPNYLNWLRSANKKFIYAGGLPIDDPRSQAKLNEMHLATNNLSLNFSENSYIRTVVGLAPLDTVPTILSKIMAYFPKNQALVLDEVSGGNFRWNAATNGPLVPSNKMMEHINDTEAALYPLLHQYKSFVVTHQPDNTFTWAPIFALTHPKPRMQIRFEQMKNEIK